MVVKLVYNMLLGGLVGLSSFWAYEASGLLAALSVMFLATWVAWRLSSPGKLWHTGSYLMNPVAGLLLSVAVGFSYVSVAGVGWFENLFFASGVSMFGLAFSLMLAKYWTIGD